VKFKGRFRWGGKKIGKGKDGKKRIKKKKKS